MAVLAKDVAGRRGARALVRLLPILAVLLAVAVVSPITDSGMRGDDSHTTIDYAGLRKADGVTVLEKISNEIEATLDGGRPQPLGAAEGTFYASVVPERFVYKLGIALLTLAALAALLAFLRSYGVARHALPIATVAFAMSLQFRNTHDPALGYYSTPQFSMLLLFGGLLAYLRYLRSGSRRSYALALGLAAAMVATYEANQPLVLAFAALHLGRVEGRARNWKTAVPFLALGAAMTILSAYLRRSAAEPSGYEASLDLVSLVLTAARQAVAGLPDIYFLSGANGLLLDPTKAEVFAALWRAALAAMIVVGALLMARDQRSSHRSDGLAIGVIGVILMALSGLYISLAAQHQELITLGTGHLATLAGTLGFVLLAVAAWAPITLRVAGHPTGIAAVGATAFALTLGTQYANMRVVAVERPGIEQRELVKAALDRGVLDAVADSTTVYINSRDLGWAFGNLVFYGGTADYLVYLRTDRKMDVRTYPAAVSCGPRTGFPVSDCMEMSPRVAWLAVRGSPGGGTVLVADGLPAAGTDVGAARSITVVARGKSATGPEPDLVGNRKNGRPWSATDERWTRTPLGDGWVRYAARIRGHRGPMAWTLNDPRSKIDFSSPTRTPGQTVRLFGTKHLLP